jgi:LCP family protein required for cell wall assembly
MQMKSKKKRDAQAELEKTAILNPEKLNRKKKDKRRKIMLMVLGGLVLFVVILCSAFQFIRAAGKSSLKSHAESARPELEILTAAEEITEDEESRWQEGWIKYKGRIYAYNEDILTFLFMGIDKNSDVKEVKEGTNGGQADALFLAVMNPHNQSIQVIGINRNTMTDIDIYNEEGAYVNTIRAQIAVQHGFGNGVEESCEYQKKAVEKLFYGLPIHGYAAINMSAISTINDAIGGVDVTVLEDLTKIDKSLQKGKNVHLMGDSAFWYIKYRNTAQFGSADLRLKRQKQYLTAFIAEAKTAVKKDVTTALDLYKAVLPQMVTDITLDELAYLAPVLADYQFDSDSFHMLEGETVMGDTFEEFYYDENQLYEMILELFYEEVE